MNMQHELMAVGAADGRYRSKVEDLAPLVSEFGLIRNRVRVECEWFLLLSEVPEIDALPTLSDAQRQRICGIAEHFTLADAERVKAIEATTNHDVKAVEYFVKERIGADQSLVGKVEFVHFACTSEDINNTAYALMLHQAREQNLLPVMQRVIDQIEALAVAHADLPMLSRTHGQTASPTTLGKELRNVAARLARQAAQFAGIELLAKFNGAVGNFNAHHCAYPEVDWPAVSKRFVERLRLTYNPFTTQIEPHDYIAELCHCLCRFNQILLDFDRDMWSYISIEYFRQRKVEGETGSSTMPHKINPIDFENSEGNLGIGSALLSHLAEKLPVSRWQRDLSDSTALRNLGTALAHCSIAYQATLKGLSRLEVNTAAITADIDNAWEVLAEAVQTVMRKHGLHEPYERLKAATRGNPIDATTFAAILKTLDLPPAALRQLQGLEPRLYKGLAAELARQPSI